MIALAVDAGGTSTRCVVVDEDGSCLGYGRAGSGNPVSVGVEFAAASVAAAAGQALAAAGALGSRVDTWLVAIAGGVADPERAVFQAPTHALGVRCPAVLRGDALATFCSGTSEVDGYALIVGTGAVGIRVEGGEITTTSDGLGWLLGDDGSGFWLGHRVARAALAALEGRGPATALTRLFTAEFTRLFGTDLPAVTARFEEGRQLAVGAALEQLYRIRPVELAQFARLAFVADADPIAEAIIADAAAALGVTLSSVMAGGRPGPVVFGGGILAHNPGFVQRISGGLPATATEVHSVPDGLAGAAVLGLRAAGQTVDRPLFERIASTLASIRS